jgi:hypothetical protein
MKRATTRAIGAVVVAACSLWAGLPVATADPATGDPGAPAADPASPDAAPDQPMAAAPGLDSAEPIALACKQFGTALNVAAANYEDFAYASAGGGNYVNYDDPNVARTSLIARAALREAASSAMSAARTPGLPPEVSDSMQTWSLRATKLVVIMSLRGGGDSLNSTVNDLNTEGHDGQMACATAGGRT